jgi:hypothetical protein
VERKAKAQERKPLDGTNEDRSVCTQDAALFLGLSPKTLEAWRLQERGPQYCRYGVNGAIRYLLSDLREFQAQHAVRPQATAAA